jgi:hypothetical protein
MHVCKAIDGRPESQGGGPWGLKWRKSEKRWGKRIRGGGDEGGCEG